MRILVLEDNQEKLDDLARQLAIIKPNADTTAARSYTEYTQLINRHEYDFLILDLVVPRFTGSTDGIVGVHEIIEQVRGDYTCPNFKTPGIALTVCEETAETWIKKLNEVDLSVITYKPGTDDWSNAIERKISTTPSSKYFDFVIICALDKEAEGYLEAGFDVGESEIVEGLRLREIKLDERVGAIVTAPRMGLVTAAITTTQVMSAFRPQVVCMSGICGGVSGQADIYDVVIAEACHQHDVGKWSDGKLKPEINSVPLNHKFAQDARRMLNETNFSKQLTTGIILTKSEFPEGIEIFSSGVKLANASSGSAVLGDDTVVDQVKEHQRKCAIFDMESYAVYEASRLAPSSPQFFSAKTVVDDGSESKSDCFHRVGCILSAKVVVRLLSLCEFD